jgi:transposase
VETLRSAEQGRRFRSLLRHARVHELHGASPSDVRLHRRARAWVGGRSKGGQEGQALGRSRGGFTTKIHAKSDASGEIIAFDLTGGEAFDGRHFETLLDIGPDIQPRAVICDKGYASKANRDAARARGIAPVIPHKANEKNKPAFFARTLYKARARIEQGVGRLKRFKRVALRCEKTERNFRSIVSFAASLRLSQIRPHSLAVGAAPDVARWVGFGYEGHNPGRRHPPRLYSCYTGGGMFAPRSVYLVLAFLCRPVRQQIAWTRAKGERRGRR